MIYLDWLLKWDEKLGHLLCFKDFLMLLSALKFVIL